MLKLKYKKNLERLIFYIITTNFFRAHDYSISLATHGVVKNRIYLLTDGCRYL